MPAETDESRAPQRRRVPIPRALLWVLGILAALLLIVFIASLFIDEPLRRMTEKKVNRDLKGYTVKIPYLHLQLIGLSMTLKKLTIIQQAHPDPPVAYFPYMKASIHWRELLSLKLVGELRLEEPRVHINLSQLKAEAQSKVPMKKKGWQQAVEDIYPLKINLLKINDARITYIDQDPKRPLVLSRLNIRADNIRNIHLPDKVYPSPFHLDTDIFGTGHGTIDGKANFLAEPTPAMKGRLKFEKVPLDYFKPIAARYNASIAGGAMRTSGEFEYAPKLKKAHLSDLTISGIKVDYLHSEKTAGTEKRRGKKVKEKAKEVTNEPTLDLRVDRLNLTGSNLGLINDQPGKRYRVYIADTDFILTNFSNQFSRGPAKAELNGKFMGSGITNVTGQFRPEKQGPDLDLYVKITNTQLTSMNDLLRAYGKFDVVAGTFSLVTELHVKNNQISGYIKPFFKDMKVYDRRQDKDKGVFRKLYEMLVGGVAKLLENRPKEQVATKAEISGPLKNPHTSTLQVVLELIRNAFIKAILPTFEREVSAAGKR